MLATKNIAKENTINIFDNNNQLVDYKKTVFVYIRRKGGRIRSCPSIRHIEETIKISSRYCKHIIVSGDLEGLAFNGIDNVIDIRNIEQSDIIKSIGPQLCNYNISLGIGGGTHIPPMYQKNMLVISSFIGIAFPYSISLPGPIRNISDIHTDSHIDRYAEISKRLYHSGESLQEKMLLKGEIEAPSIESTSKACIEYFERECFPKSGYVHGRKFNLAHLTEKPNEHLCNTYTSRQ